MDPCWASMAPWGTALALLLAAVLCCQPCQAPLSEGSACPAPWQMPPSFCRLQPGMWYSCCIAQPRTLPHLLSCSVTTRLRPRSVNPESPLYVIIGMKPAGKPSPRHPPGLAMSSCIKVWWLSVPGEHSVSAPAPGTCSLPAGPLALGVLWPLKCSALPQVSLGWRKRRKPCLA